MPTNALLIAAALGVVQGLTEFLPVSSSAHLILTRDYFGWTMGGGEADLLFDVVLNTGTMLALIVYFWKDLIRIFGSLLSSSPERGADRRLAISILIATIPAAVVGAKYDKEIEHVFRSHVSIILSLLAGVGILMLVADWLGKKRREASTLKVWEVFLIGLAQACALMPGVSRSGATISTGLALGLKREEAARFAFLLSAPISVGAAVWAIKKAVQMRVPTEMYAPMGVGLVVSAVVGYLSIALLLRFVRRNNLAVFTVYRCALACFLFFALVRP